MILNTLRHEIAEGHYAPGEQLPTRSELEQRFGVSRQTVQHVFDQLIAEGFVESRGRGGTFVSPHPPHLNQYAIVFPYSPESWEGWTQLWWVLMRVAEEVNERDGRCFHFFYGDRPHTERDSYDGLIERVDARRISGSILATRASFARDRVVRERPDLPVVALSDEHDPRVVNLNLDFHSFLKEATREAARRGRRRVAYLLPSVWEADAYERSISFVLEAVSQAGMKTRPGWMIGVPPLQPHWARNVVDLLMACGPDRQPDALVIANDNLVRDSLSAVREAGVRVGEDLDIVTHTNFPMPVPSDLPVTRIGFDIREVLTRATELIDRRQRGEELPVRVDMRAKHESEVKGVDGPSAAAGK